MNVMKGQSKKATPSHPCRYVWTRRHYIPVLIGAVSAAVYASGVRYGIPYVNAHAEKFNIPFVIPNPDWLVPVTAQVVLWLAVWCARQVWFD